MKYPMKRIPGLSLALLLTAGSPVLLAVEGPTAGPEFQVNTYTLDFQALSDVAAGPNGELIVVWVSQGSDGTDSSFMSIQGQRFQASGDPLGAEFQVNTYTTFAQVLPRVAHTGEGRFVVVWESDGSFDSDDDGRSVQAQRFLANGDPDGPEFQVNSFTTGYQVAPAVAAAVDGRFAVVWWSSGSAGTDTSLGSVQLRRFLADGTPAGLDTQVNTYTTGPQRYPAIDVASDGTFVVAWDSFGSAGSDTDDASIQARRFAADGTPNGTQFQVNSYITSTQRFPDVTSLQNGGFVVAWESNGSFGTDSYSYSAQARIADATGLPIDLEFQVNTYTSQGQDRVRLSAAEDGSFVVTWTSDGSAGTDNSPSSGTSVQQRRILADGTPATPQFQVNTLTTVGQSDSSVATLANGDFVIAWQSEVSSGSDTSSLSIQARRFSPHCFSDGFESGDTTAWSIALP